MKNKKTKLLYSALSLLLCIAMLAGSTFAWFTDSVTSGINTIAAGNLDVELYHSNAAVTDEKVKEDTKLFLDLQGDPILWEPGVVSYENLRVVNEGDLALVYRLAINTANENYILDPENGTMYGLSQILKVGFVEGGITATDRAGVVASVDTANWTTLSDFLRNGSLLPEGKGASEQTWGIVIWWEPGDNDNRWNLNNGKTLNEGDVLKLDLGISLVATQEVFENDSFGSDYDTDAKTGLFPNFTGSTVTTPVTPNAENKTDAEVTMSAGQVSAAVPAGTQLAAGTTALTLTVTELEATGSNIVLGENEAIRSLDVHIEGVASDNTAPITVTLTEIAPVGLNMGNYKLYHVENGATNEMTLVASADAFTAHNQFKYDPATGTIVLYMATFSEVALTANEVNAWEGNLDYTWYDPEATQLTIANADQLAAFGAIVGGMKKVTGRVDNKYIYSDEVIQDSFAGKTVKLIADINLGDAEAQNNPDLIFYPIGYWNNEGIYEKTDTAVSSGFYTFEGTFDGNGNVISNFYQNTWEMKGDHDWYDAALQYYRDGMGLFGKVYGGTIKNLTVQNFSCDSEIGTSGVIAAYADSKAGVPAVFENITIEGCNSRVYNIGNGGIVGCAGWYSRNESLGTANYDNAVTFRNITVDQTNKLSALWGSWGVSCGGILGQYYPDSACGIKMVNCHVAAIIDVNNDVCSNYQYYWYRYAGMFIGTIRKNTNDADGNTIADTTGISASNCTYTMGQWNEYWYCEIVANSLASYTHDHQFSRLDNIYSLSEIRDGEAWLKEGHFALLDENRNIVDCYHIFKNSNGELYRHFHDVADESNPNIYETFDLDGNGKLDDLKEDRQRYFIPFNQLLTGLDMGIKAHTSFDGITFVEHGTTKSVQKFNATGKNVVPESGVVSIGELFEASGNGAISAPTVQVYVSPVGVGSNVRATYSGNVADWEKGTLTFSGCGAAKVVITDYYYCTATTLNIYVLGGEYYIGATTSNGSNWYLTSDLGASGSNRFLAEQVNGEFPGMIAAGGANKVFCFVAQGNDQFVIQNGNKYLAWTSDNNVQLVADAASATKVTVRYHAENKMFHVFFQNNDATRYLSRNNNASDKYFAWYAGTQINDLKLIPVQTCFHTNTTTTSKAPTCTEPGFEGLVICDDCLAIIEEGENIKATGHNYVNGVCSCGAQEMAAKVTSIAVGDTVILVYETGKMELKDITTTGTKYGIGVAYSNAPDGVMALTVEKGATAGTYAFKIKDGVYLNWSSGNTLSTASTISENSSWNVTFDTAGNAIITNAEDSTRRVLWNTSSPRFACYTSVSNQTAVVQLYGTGAAVCQHTNTARSDDASNATCTTAGWEASIYCMDCGKTLTEGKEIPALGHNYQDGVCVNCGDHQQTTTGWVLVTDASQLEEGDQIVIVAKGYDYALSTAQNNNNRGSVAITKDANTNTVTINDEVQVLTLKAGTVSGTFGLYTGSGYLYAASNSSNHLKTQTTNNANGSWSITINASTGAATIQAEGTNSHNLIRFNEKNSPKLFSAYGSGQQDVAIYMYVEA